ncbi:MAG: glycoside hydrolase N-terminal domain-containing protein [Kiritimatiellae bacterium]|nr:glycoside hydrolase N-terminal domain-containing protein [Kiritimatiellia bacterium]
MKLCAMTMVTMSAFCAGAFAAPETTLWYNRPAASWEANALPIGNGRLGAMAFGGVEDDRFQLNIDSLWTGDENPSGSYESMGEYRTLGNLYLSGRGEPAAAAVACTSGQKAFYEQQEVDRSADGDPETKWCVEHQGKPLVWEVTLPGGSQAPLTTYALVSASDVPERDPKNWTLEGSDDGAAWTVLDRQSDQAPAARKGVRSYSCTNEREYRRYRLTIQPNAGTPHIQVAEIQIPGVTPLKAANAGAVAGAAEYRRALDVRTGVHTVRWTQDGVTHTRESFISAPDDVLVIRWSANRPGAISGQLRLEDGQTNASGSATHSSVAFSGTLSNGLRYAAQADVEVRGGQIVAGDDHKVSFEGCEAVMVRFAAATDYAMDRTQQWRSKQAPGETIVRTLSAARGRSWDDLYRRHVDDHAAIYDRCVLDLGPAPAAARNLPINERIQRFKKSPDDRSLEALLFAYGRYLLAGSSRRGTLPANLQGIWNESNNPPWHSDYHSNINLQMNYWLAEVTGLADMHTPLFDYLDAMAPVYREVAQREFKTSHGWTVRTSHNITGGQGWQWNIPGSAWYARHYYEHAMHAAEAAFAKDRAYPVLREVCDFWADHLKALPDGTLVAPNGWSPEHGPREDGVSHDQQIIWDLFQNYIEISRWIGGDPEHRARIAALQAKLAGPKIGRWGQLMEWRVDRDDPNTRHRHTSHLYAVYPGRQISRAGTPEYARAAAISLEARGTTDDSRRSWTWPWRTALWARLGEPEKAHEMVKNLIRHNLLENMITTHRPLQLDGNFGFPGGVSEMLLQSHDVLPGVEQKDGERPAFVVELLPALPSAWANGVVKGLRARGGFTVSMMWSRGALQRAVITSERDAVVPVRYRGRIIRVTVRAGESVRLEPQQFATP